MLVLPDQGARGASAIPVGESVLLELLDDPDVPEDEDWVVMPNFEL
jgi:hypothetical protein